MGDLQCDLVHLRKKDVGDWGGFLEGSDKYFLTVIEITTNYFGAKLVHTKEAKPVTKAMSIILKDFKKHFKLKSVASDQGKEFLNREFQRLLKKENIKHKAIKGMAPAIESRNAVFQRYFYLLMRQKRKAISQTIRLTVDILNNLVNRRSGLTPNESLGKSFKQIAAARKKYRREPKKVQHKKPLEIGTTVRYLVQSRKDKAFYKSYRGEQWSKRVLKRKKIGHNVYKYLVNENWYFHNDLLVAPTDKKSEKLLRERKEKIGSVGDDPEEFKLDVEVQPKKRSRRSIRYKVGAKIMYKNMPGVIRGVDGSVYDVELKNKKRVKTKDVRQRY